MKIAVIVHNQISRDARVRKECSSLKQNKFDVTLFGYGSDRNKITYIENCKAHIIKGVDFRLFAEIFYKFKKIIIYFYKRKGFSLNLIFKKIFFNKLFVFFGSFLLILIKRNSNRLYFFILSGEQPFWSPSGLWNSPDWDLALKTLHAFFI